VLIMLVTGGCQNDESAPIRIPIDPDDIAPTCAAYVTCTNHLLGMGICVATLTSALYWDLEAVAFTLATDPGEHFMNILGGMQNSACIAQTEGDCDKVIACANQGQAVRNCTPREGYYRNRYCRDAVTLAACTPTGTDGETVETSVRCDDLGMECVEIDRENDRFAACGHWARDTVEGVQATCDGTLARVQRKNAYFFSDCAWMNSGCREGTYQSWDNYEFCESDGPVCDPGSMEPHCGGNATVTYCNGRELGISCDNYDQICENTRILTITEPVCIYKDSGCNPFSFQETCEAGRITYCGPQGITTLSCTRLGYSGCEMDLVFANCRE
jgi:hypothetical protein